MREYNNQDIKSNEAELDPCIAAEIRMKKAIFSHRARRSLLILIIVIVSLILFSLLLIFLFSKSASKRAEAAERNRSNHENEYALESTTEVSFSLESTTEVSFSLESTTEVSFSLESTTEVSFSSLPKIYSSKETIQETMNEMELELEKEMENVALSPQSSVFVSTLTSKYVPTTDMTTSAIFDEISEFFDELSSNWTETTTEIISTTDSSIKQVEKTTVSEPVVDEDEDQIKAEDCKFLLRKGATQNGIYQIYLPKLGKFEVLCDMETSGGGWTVIQKRENEQVHFANRTWNEYQNGFGELNTSFWLGLDKIHALVAKDGGVPVTLRIELRGDFCEGDSGCSKQPDGFWWGEWDFKIADSSHNYRLTISAAVAGNLSERTTTDRFHYMNNQKPFTTIDRDNDNFQGNCAQFRDFGGWWHNDCGYVALNGRYGDRTSKMRNMFWFYGSGKRPFVNYYIKPRQSQMKLRSKI